MIVRMSMAAAVIVGACVACVSVALPAAASTPADAAASQRADEKDILETIKNSPQLGKLNEAIKAAGLTGELKGKGPFTVLAPTDDAFKKLPAGTWDSWMKPENKAELLRVLKRHIIKGVGMKSEDFKSIAETRATLQGDKLKVKVRSGKIWVEGKAAVTKTDTACSNGQIQMIDAVLTPEEKGKKDGPGKERAKPGSGK